MVSVTTTLTHHSLHDVFGEGEGHGKEAGPEDPGNDDHDEESLQSDGQGKGHHGRRRRQVSQRELHPAACGCIVQHH